MATLIFDIATVGEDWAEMDHLTRSRLTRFDDAESAEAKLALSPLTGSIVALGLYDVERQQGMVYLTGGKEGEPEYKKRSEQELLEDFWEGAQSYDVFVTFGGRRFDIPWLLHRSALRGVAPSREFRFARSVERQQVPYHVDLHDEFSRHGDLRAPVSLHLLARAYGLNSPDDGAVSGETVGENFKAGKFTELARYTEQNVAITTELYRCWLKQFAPASFLNILL